MYEFFFSVLDYRD